MGGLHHMQAMYSKAALVLARTTMGCVLVFGGPCSETDVGWHCAGFDPIQLCCAAYDVVHMR